MCSSLNHTSDIFPLIPSTAFYSGSGFLRGTAVVRRSLGGDHFPVTLLRVFPGIARLSERELQLVAGRE